MLETHRRHSSEPYKRAIVYIISFREATHIEFAHKKRQSYVWVCVFMWGEDGGGGLAGVTFLCDTLWENSIFLLKNFLTFWNNLGKGYKITFVSDSSSSSFSFFTKFILLI